MSREQECGFNHLTGRINQMHVRETCIKCDGGVQRGHVTEAFLSLLVKY